MTDSQQELKPLYQSPIVVSYAAHALMQQLGAARAFSETIGVSPDEDLFDD